MPPSLNKYLYAYQNPTVFVDPDGREAVLPLSSSGAGVGVWADPLATYGNRAARTLSGEHLDYGNPYFYRKEYERRPSLTTGIQAVAEEGLDAAQGMSFKRTMTSALLKTDVGLVVGLTKVVSDFFVSEDTGGVGITVTPATDPIPASESYPAHDAGMPTSTAGMPIHEQSPDDYIYSQPYEGERRGWSTSYPDQSDEIDRSPYRSESDDGYRYGDATRELRERAARAYGNGDENVTNKVGREDRWLELANQPNSRLPKEMIDHINRHDGKGVAGRFGQELAHKPKKASAQGHDYSEAIPKTAADHRGIQHRYLKERSAGTTISMPKNKRGKGKLSLPPKGALP